MDSIWRNLSYFLHLLIGVVCVNSLPVDHGRWLAAKLAVKPLYFELESHVLATESVDRLLQYAMQSIKPRSGEILVA